MRSYFHRDPPSLWQPNCFLIAPLGAGESRERADEIFKVIGACAAEFGYKCWRDVDIFTSRTFMETIRQGLEWSNFVVADMSDTRNNCFYELGIADGLARPVLLIARKGTVVPQDLGGRQWLFYEDPETLKSKITNWIFDTVIFSDRLPESEDSRRAKYGKRCFSEGYLLSAFLRSDGDREDDRVWFSLCASVRHIEKKMGSNSAVTFLLDRSFGDAKRFKIAARRGIVNMEIRCYGAFTLAAVINHKGKKIQLELDLSNVPGSNPTFRYE